jgi:hypothetical protein
MKLIRRFWAWLTFQDEVIIEECAYPLIEWKI